MLLDCKVNVDITLVLGVLDNGDIGVPGGETRRKRYHITEDLFEKNNKTAQTETLNLCLGG